MESHIHFMDTHAALAPGICGCQQQYETNTQTHTLIQRYTVLGTWSVLVLHTHTHIHTHTHTHTHTHSYINTLDADIKLDMPIH